MVAFTGTPYKLAEEPFATTGVPSLISEDGAGNIVRSPNRLFLTRADLAAAKIMAGVTTVTVERYAAAGPVLNMTYSINDTTQVSTDPTSMAVTVVAADGTTSTKYTKLISARVTPAMMAAPINGTDDDAVAINRCLTYFGNCYPDAAGPVWVNYFIRTPVKFASKQIFNFRGWLGWLEIDLSAFTNTDYNTGVYSDLSTVFQMHGSTTGTDIPLDSIMFVGARIRPKATVLQRYTYVVSARNVTNLEITGNEITGFAAGFMIAINSCDGGKQEISSNYIHDLLVNTTFPNGVNSTQMSGINVDADRAHSTKLSKRLHIKDNCIRDFVTGATTLAAYNSRQQDAINLTGQGDVFILVEGNIITGVNQAVASFGKRTSIIDNMIDNVANAFHFDHGFCNSLVEGNIGTNIKLVGVAMASRTGEDCRNNKISGNKIHVIGGDEYAATWAAVSMEENGSGVLDGNVFEGNTYECAAATTVFYNQCATGRNRSSGDTFLSFGTDARSCVLATASDKTLLLIERPVNPTKIKVALASAYTKTGSALTEIKIPFDTVIVDARSEWDAGNTRANLVMPGWYRLRLVLNTTNFKTGTRYLFHINSSSTDGGSRAELIKFEQVQADIANKTLEYANSMFLNYGALITATVQQFTSTGNWIIDASPDSYLEILKE